VAVHLSNRPPAPDPGETIPARRWLEKTQETLFWLPRQVPRGPMGVAMGVGGLLAVSGIVIGITAAFSGGGSEPSAAAAGHSAPAAPVSLPPSPRPAPASAPTEVQSSGVPVISVDNLPQATNRAAATTKGIGHLSLVSSPAACQVAVEGVTRGTTPIVSLDLTAGVHRVECVGASGRSRSANIAVVEGGSTHYAFTLEE
jgi:hypothetical protein